MTDTVIQRSHETEQDDRTLRISRIFDAPPAAVFRAWTDPELLVKWWGPEGCSATVTKLDLQPGGTWRTSIINADGEEHFVGGTYQEINPPERLVFTWAWENVEVKNSTPGHQTTITLEFQDHDGSTEMVLTQTRFESTDIRDLHDTGWSSSLNCLNNIL